MLGPNTVRGRYMLTPIPCSLNRWNWSCARFRRRRAPSCSRASRTSRLTLLASRRTSCACLSVTFYVFAHALACEQKAVSSTSTSQRDELLSGGSDLDGTSADQRARLLNANARLENSSRRLDESTRIAYETEALGADILSQLGSQRETIVSARKKVRRSWFCASARTDARPRAHSWTMWTKTSKTATRFCVPWVGGSCFSDRLSHPILSFAVHMCCFAAVFLSVERLPCVVVLFAAHRTQCRQQYGC